jgi:hypothetical protein
MSGLSYWQFHYRDASNQRKAGHISAQDVEQAREIVKAWQRHMEIDNNRHVWPLPNPEQPSCTPFCVAGPEILEKEKEREKEVIVESQLFMPVDYHALSGAQVQEGLKSGILDPEAVHAMEMQGKQRKGVLTAVSELMIQGEPEPIEAVDPGGFESPALEPSTPAP